MTQRFKAFSPDGIEIVATLDRIYGRALITDFELDEFGNHSPNYSGHTYVCWDSQVVEEINGQSIYVDDNYREWPESALTFKPIEPEPPKTESTWEDDNVQFPRLIAELEAAAAFTPEVLDALSASMDLEPSEVHELIERAVTSWDEIVRNTPAPAVAGE